MAERRKSGRKKSNDQSKKLTKEEDAIARFVRFNCPTKSTMFEGNEVHYFSGTKAVDTLYNSKKYGHAAKNVKFGTRQAVVTFMRTLLEKGLFFRARKLVPKKKDEKRDVKEKKRCDVSKSPKKKAKEDQFEKEGEEKKGVPEENEEENEKKDKKKEEEEKKKRKVKLELHQDQSFNDANDVYVWIFDPTPLYKKIIGAFMVLGTIAGCLFPLWPIWLRQGVYYLSVAGLACFGLLIGVALARTMLFAIIWAVTMGRHKLWLLPNLTEDCGFFESFQPWYTYEYCPDGINADDKKKKKGSGKKKNDEKLLLDKDSKSGEADGSKVRKNDTDEAVKKESKKSEENGEGENFDADTDFLNNEETDGTDEKSDISEFGDGSSQETTGGSLNDNGDVESVSIYGNGEEEGKVRVRRRIRKTDDDFIIVGK